MSKGMFDRLFKFLVKKCNETLDTQQKRQSFIGVLDIAGFEIFDVSYFSNPSSYYLKKSFFSFTSDVDHSPNIVSHFCDQ